MLIRLLLVLLCLPALAQGAVIETVEWDSLPGGAWTYTSGGVPAVDCAVTPSPSGGCALKFTYNAGTYGTSFSGGRATKAPIGSNPTDLYVGQWMRYSSPATFNCIGQKVDQFAMDGAASALNFPNNIQVGFGGCGTALRATQQIVWGPGTRNFEANMQSFSAADTTDQWFWLEWHVQLNTPGVANGIIEAWVDDVLRLRHTDVAIRDASTSASTGWNQFDHTAEWGGGGGTIPSTYYWWVDHTVLSTTRIGRPGGVPPPSNNDTVAPSAPTGLAVN